MAVLEVAGSGVCAMRRLFSLHSEALAQRRRGPQRMRYAVASGLRDTLVGFSAVECLAPWYLRKRCQSLCALPSTSAFFSPRTSRKAPNTGRTVVASSPRARYSKSTNAEKAPNPKAVEAGGRKKEQVRKYRQQPENHSQSTAGNLH